MSRKTTAIALATATALAGPPAAADAVRPPGQETARDAPGETHDLPPALDAFLDIVAGIPGEAYREPAWRNPHASPRPSPDRDFVFPPFGKRRGA